MSNYDSTSVEEFVTALKSLPDWCREILVFQFQSPRYKITARQLARHLGYQHFVQGNQRYGNMAHLVCESLRVAKPPSNQWFAALSKAYHSGKTWIWIMRPNLVEAIKQLGWQQDNLMLTHEGSVGTNTFLFTWNPKQWQWDDLALHANENASGKAVSERWSCHANFKRIKKGDRAFLIRLGEEPKGIIASGWITSDPRLGLHWNKGKAALGEKTFFADCEWERLLNPFIDEPLSLSRLQIGKLATMRWTPQSSGVLIPIEVAEELERVWAEHIGASSLGSVFVDDEIRAFEGEERMALIRHRRREQKLRDAKLKQAREKNRGRLICEVPGCGFDFEAVYGELGRNYAQVHHLKPLGDRTTPSETKLSDLVIVCANCHAMIHRSGKRRSLENLILIK